MPYVLDRHGVIEASAGTGKTYTIEELVVRLLEELRLPLEKILLVTFTEKAAAELRERLRGRLERTLKDRPDLAPCLQHSLDHFDQAPIFTIHGFSQRLLSDFAFDQSQDFRAELIRDQDLLEPALREVQRRQWRQELGPWLGQVLELSGYTRAKAEKWEDLIRALARIVHPEAGHRLVPEPLADWAGCLPALVEKINHAVGQLQTLAGIPWNGPWNKHPWHTEFSQVPIHAGRRRSLSENVLLPLLDWLAQVFEPDALTRDAKTLASASGSHSPLLSCWRFFGQVYREDRLQKFLSTGTACQQGSPLHQAIALLDDLRQAVAWPEVTHQLAVRTVVLVQQQVAEFKRQRGQWSFHDMIARLARGLDPCHNPRADALLHTLREQYRYAIIDEFQDTDPLQWQIFRSIFLDGGQTRLWVVGDPKQGIYGFRGADLPTYLQAVTEMTAQHGAKDYPLEVNWRSCPDLLDALNRLFQDGNWFPPGDEISFQPVHAPPTGTDKALLADSTGRAALTVVDLIQAKSLSKARRENARFIVDEIGRLLGGPETMTIRVRDEERPIQAGDIAILVFKRNEAGPLVKLLRRARIPCTFYKEQGLWQADEALQLSVLLEALARPDSAASLPQALLTAFFRVRPEELTQCGEIPPHHPARRLFQRWLALAEQRKWAAFFQSILEQTGVLFQREVEGDPDRRLANFRYLTQALQETAHAENLDLLGLVERLRRNRCQRDADEADIQPIDTERPKVQIMTIHACKGLEFPVVFLAGGFTGRKALAYSVYRVAGQKVFDLVRGESARAAAAQESGAEDRRLLYVALTRAMFKLYVPRVDENLKRAPGPVATILAPALERSDVTALGRPKAEMIAVVRPQEQPSHRQKKPERGSSELASPSQIDGPLFPKLAADLASRRTLIRSFSSLHQAALREREEATFGDAPEPTADDDPGTPEDPEPLRGPVFGDMVHNVLESIDFTQVGAARSPEALLEEGAAARLLIDRQMHDHLHKVRTRVEASQLESLCRRQMAGLVWNALHTPLGNLGPLWKIPPEDRSAEMEFHFPDYGPAALPEETTREQGFITGFMDLVLRKQGRIYLVDWKTNLLPSYGPEAIAASMKEADYFLQFRLYLQALARWHRRVHGRDDFLDHCGGVYYLYVRGLNGRDDTSGVFFHRPVSADLMTHWTTTV